MRVLVVTQYFWPENFRINDLVLELKHRGHELTILTGKPNYPLGKIFPEFKTDPSQYQNFDGIEGSMTISVESHDTVPGY